MEVIYVFSNVSYIILVRANEKLIYVSYLFYQTLGFESYSILGFCAGGATALILAANYPQRVVNVAVWGTKAYVGETDKQNVRRFMSGETLSQSANDANIIIYGEEECKRMYENLSDAFFKMGDICKSDLPNVECPVLILHGEADNWITKEHPLYLAENIKKAKLHIFPEGKHFLHHKYAEEFNKIVETYMLQNETAQ